MAISSRNTAPKKKQSIHYYKIDYRYTALQKRLQNSFLGLLLSAAALGMAGCAENPFLVDETRIVTLVVMPEQDYMQQHFLQTLSDVKVLHPSYKQCDYA